MPRYDFECPHGHTFEHDCLMADRGKSVPCEGVVNQLVDDDEAVSRHTVNQNLPLPDGWKWVSVHPERTNGKSERKVLVKEVSCILMATKVGISFSSSNSILDHGMATNRDAAREGRYDPLNPNRRFMAKGRQWRR